MNEFFSLSKTQVNEDSQDRNWLRTSSQTAWLQIQSNISNRLTDQSPKMESFDACEEAFEPFGQFNYLQNASKSLSSVNSGNNSNSGSTTSLSISANLFDHGLQRDNLNRVQFNKDFVSLQSLLLKPTVSYESNRNGSN